MISTKHKRIYIAKPVEIDRDELYGRILDMMERVDGMTDEEIRESVAEITGTYTFKK